jgi:hypothetical protein
MSNEKKYANLKFNIHGIWFFPLSFFFYKAYFILFLLSVSGTVIGSYQEFSESDNGNMIGGLLKN